MTPLTAMAQHGGGMGGHGGWGGGGGGGWHGAGAGWGGGGGWRGGGHFHGCCGYYYPFFGAFALGFAAAYPWYYWGDPYGYYGPGYGYGYGYGYYGYPGDGDGYGYPYDGYGPNGYPPASGYAAPQACGHWVWSAEQSQYQWVPASCAAPAPQAAPYAAPAPYAPAPAPRG